ncbi:MAG: alpha/beta fold hydrolase [Ginsengibacter sp.]
MTEEQTNDPVKKNIKKKIFGWGKAVIIIYCSIGIALYYLQEKFMFHPVPLPPGYIFNFNFSFKEVNIPMNKTDTLNLVQFFTADDKPKGVVLYFHGNRGNINRYAKYAENFTKNGYEVWMPDYPGYGKTTGKLSEENLYKQANEVYKLANSEFDNDSILIYGKSLGSGIAAWLASKKTCKRIMLETPYYSMANLLHHYAPVYPTGKMSHFNLPTFEYLQKIQAPVTIFHGTEDRVIPYKTALRLIKFFKPGDEFITIAKGEHNNLNDFPLFHENLDSLLGK